MKLLIKNGRIIDPKNKVDSIQDLLIIDGKIEEYLNIGEVVEADNVIEAEGLVVCPGFVDMHMHEDPYNEENDDFEIGIFNCMLQMGVTTAIGGNCGVGPIHPSLYLEKVDMKGLPINVGLMLPHEALRNLVGEHNKYLPVINEENLKKMLYKTYEELEKGMLGLSFGIRYIPGLNFNELVKLSRAVKFNNKMVAAHIRDDAAKVIEATSELLEIGEILGIKIQNSHIGSMGAYGQMAELLRLMDQSKSRGIDIGFDCYPYEAFSTGIGETTYDEGFLERYNIEYDRIEVAEGPYVGKRLNKELFFHLRKSRPDTITIGHVMKSEEVDLALAHPNTIVASDGFMHKLQGHPRASGTFPRIINEYYKHKKIFSLNEAIAKMTFMPAERLGIKKGSIGKGDDADLVIFNLDEIKDRSDFEKPFLEPDGINYVIINGEIAVENKKIVNNRLGKSVRK
jgi:N-acyl-D-amino-acid deacylase